jgi:pyruvate dehydrogenase E2 component (dihydrolipoamide acetyltransferase)
MTAALAIPHIHGADEFDASALLSGRRRIKELHPARAARLTPLSFFVMAVAEGLRRFPMVNASIELDAAGSGHIDVHDEIHIGIAVATDAGLVVPVVRHADQQSLFDLADEIQRLSTACRDRTIGTTDLQGGTATITNYGSLGGRFATPMIRPPEAVIVGFGSIRERPIVVAGDVVARPTLPISIAVDHRLIDGDLMTAFQEHIIGLLSDPVALLAR